MLQLANPSITDIEKTFVRQALDSTNISGSGPFVLTFSKYMAAKTGRQFAVPVANGTVALELALRALNVGPGDEVIIPALTYAAVVNAVLNVCASPVIVDVDPSTWMISVEEAKKAVTKQTKAIIGVNLFGNIPDYTALQKLGVKVIEDASQSHGSSRYGRAAGGHGIISTFSFHASKTITSGEGGMVLTDHPDLYESMDMIVNNGAKRSQHYTHLVVGSNYRLSNVCAAIGAGQMSRWDELCASKEHTERMYTLHFGEEEGVGLPKLKGVKRVCWVYATQLTRAPEVVDLMQKAGVEARVIWPSLADTRIYAHYAKPCPVAEELQSQIVMLPTWQRMTASVQSLVIQEFDKAVDAVYNQRN